ncbi:MAG TPA: response regulator [Anaerolineales bacterium]|nr:response regulator [Anaerolineales bacterium]
MKKVMLIEDDQTMLSLLSTLLDMEGYDVHKLDEFSNVIKEIKNVKPDAVLMDVHLDDIDGLEILTELRNDQELNTLKVIMSSGMDVSHQSMDKGADDFLLKPYMPDELIGKVKQLVEG